MPTQRRNRSGGVLAGCLAVLGVVVVLLVAGGIFVAMNWRGWAAGWGEQALTALIDEADLDETAKASMKLEVTELMHEFENGDVTLEQLGKVAEELSRSPVLPAASIMLVDSKYIKSSDLSEEEKAEGSKQLSRFMRGLFEESISQTKIDDVTEPIHAHGAPNAFRINASNLNIELKHPDDVTPEELSAFLANCKAAADEAGVPDERYQVDMAQEFSDAIDRALGRAPPLPDSGEADDAGEAGDDAVEDTDEGTPGDDAEGDDGSGG